MKIGDIVRHRETGTYGTVHYSSFGVSIHIWYEGKGLGKTQGHPAQELLEYWEVVDMPKGYELHPYGGLRKISQTVYILHYEDELFRGGGRSGIRAYDLEARAKANAKAISESSKYDLEKFSVEKYVRVEGNQD